MTQPRRILVAAFALCAVTRIVDTLAEPPDLLKVRNAIVIVVAKGVLTNLGNAPAVAQATGFFVSKDGFLVTSYHLRTELGDVDEQSVAYELRFGPSSTDIVSAAPVFINPAADVMVLYAPVGDRDVDILVPGSRAGVMAGTTPVYTVGYPAGLQYSVDTGVIKSFGGLIEPIPAWTTSMTFKSGQSGSPILLESLRVVAIAKGNDATSTSTGLIVPSRLVPENFWDGTLKLSPNVAAALAKAESKSFSRIFVQAALDSEAPSQRRGVFSLRNELCDDSTSKEYRVAATPGWTIDSGSINVEMLSFTGASARYAVTERNRDGFTVAAELANIGKCVTVFNQTIKAGVAAEFTAQVTYRERPVESTPRFVTISSTAAIGNIQTPVPDVPRDQLKFYVTTPSGSMMPFEPKADELRMKKGVLVLDTQRVEERLLN